MATIVENYPLYYDATNEFGLSAAGLNFPGNAVYFPAKNDHINIAPFELIPYILCKCKTISDVKSLLQNCNIVNLSYSKMLPNTPLHWVISDKYETIVVESTANGLEIFDNPIHVLTNNPPFPYHLCNLNNYINVTASEPQNRFCKNLNLNVYSFGMGGYGLPGDLSSSSRFVRAAFTLHNSISGDTFSSEIHQFFHILDSVKQPLGCVRVGEGYEFTLYSSCCDTQNLIYYYCTYENRQISSVKMKSENLDSNKLIMHPVIKTVQIVEQN
jgi:choloylglycine hydrolase